QELLAESLRKQALKERSSLLLLQAQLARERQNLQTFEAAYQKTQDLFFAGKANTLTLRDSELARLNVLLRIDDLKVEAFQASMRLQQLRGALVQN
ncbi:MAG: hypothetical protein AAF804_08725, partial [Bacteroidota bacterium]